MKPHFGHSHIYKITAFLQIQIICGTSWTAEIENLHESGNLVIAYVKVKLIIRNLSINLLVMTFYIYRILKMSLTVRTFSCYLLRKSSRQLSSRFLSTSSISSQSQFSSPSKSQLSNQQSSLPPLAPEKWDLYAGVVLERKPVLTPEMTPLEKEYSTLLSKYEFELSKKSSHEVRKEKDSYVTKYI